MRIEEVDFFYASMPEITLDADGSQDALLVRVTADDGVEGWGECEASPLVSVAAFVAPRSHGACQPVAASVLGERLDGPADVARIAAQVRRNSMDLLQAPHTWSGIEIALWDLIGRSRAEPVWRLLGGRVAHPKTAYASLLFGHSPQETLERTALAVDRGFGAVKLGWSRFGAGQVADDADHLMAAREALGPDGILLVDAGQVWVEDVDAATDRLEALRRAGVRWLEEPFSADAYAAYASLAAVAGPVGLAGGEASHSARMATNLIDYARISFVQVDAGRIGGIGPAAQVAAYADSRGVTYVNHTFTSHLALSASLQPYAALAGHRLCEYPLDPRPVAAAVVRAPLVVHDGELSAPDAPGLGVQVDLDALDPYLVDVDIVVAGASLVSLPGRGVGR